MNDAIMRVSNSPRMRRFSATFAMIYLAVDLIMNYIGLLPLFDKAPMSYLFALLNYAVQAPLLFGFVRGVTTREYSLSKVLSAYGETDKYPFYLSYICVGMAFDIVVDLVGMIGGTVGLVASAVMIVLRFPIKFLLVGILFDAIFSDGDKPRFSPSGIIERFTSAVTQNPARVFVAEIFMMVISFLSIYIAVMLAELLPAHWTVSYALTCLKDVQFGLIILSWPVYYLYCKSAYGITAFDEPRGRR